MGVVCDRAQNKKPRAACNLQTARGIIILSREGGFVVMAETQDNVELLSDHQEEDEGPVETSHEMNSALAVTAAASLRCKYDFDQ